MPPLRHSKRHLFSGKLEKILLLNFDLPLQNFKPFTGSGTICIINQQGVFTSLFLRLKSTLKRSTKTEITDQHKLIRKPRSIFILFVTSIHQFPNLPIHDFYYQNMYLLFFLDWNHRTFPKSLGGQSYTSVVRGLGVSSNKKNVTFPAFF